WQAAFTGGYETDEDVGYTKDPKALWKEDPGASIFALFYLLLFIITFLLAAGIFVLGLLHIRLGPGLERLMPWRWGVIAILQFILLGCLGMQLLVGFSMEAQVSERVNEEYKNRVKDAKETDKKKA